jgi:hypothetical protein
MPIDRNQMKKLAPTNCRPCLRCVAMQQKIAPTTNSAMDRNQTNTDAMPSPRSHLPSRFLLEV